MKMDLNDAEQLQRIVVAPLIAAVRAEMQTLIGRVDSVEGDVKSMADDVAKLKSNQSKALVGWTLLVTLVSAGVTWAKVAIFG